MSDTAGAGATKAQLGRRIHFRFLREYGIVFAFVAVFAVLSLLSPAFFTLRNMANVLDQSAQVGLVAVGATITIIGGGFDLSSGAIFAASGSLAAYIARLGYPVLGLSAGVLLGAILGILNGAMIAGIRINSFVATLASGLVIRGLAYVMTQGLLIQIDDERFAALGQLRVLEVKLPVYILFIFAIIAWFLLSRTAFGRYVYAIGGNEEAARLSGVRVKVVRTATFMLSGLAAGLAGIIGASRITTGQANVGTGLELSAIAAVVIGGTSIMGGEGAVWRTLLGVILLQLISNGMNILNVPSFYQLVVQGGVILFAVSLDALRHRGR